MIKNVSAVIHAPFAAIGIVTNEHAITDLLLSAIDSTPCLSPCKGSLAELACQQLEAYLKDSRFIFELPLHISGTDHQIKVWRAMQLVASGSTCTYGELAKWTNSSARAVGQTCGRNPIPIIIPCHRIISANGTLGGFMRGQTDHALSIKRWLLSHEGHSI